MCLIRVGRVIKIDNKKAICDFDGIIKEASSTLFPTLKVGDDVVVNCGFISDIIRNKKELYKQVIYTDALNERVLSEIDKYAKLFEAEIRILSVSSINDYLIEKYSIKDLLPKSINLISHPSDSNISLIKKNTNANIIIAKESVSEILEAVLSILKNLYKETSKEHR